MTDRGMERVVSAFVLAGAGVFVALLLAVGFGEEWIRPAGHYTLVLDNGYGIAPGTPVTVLGLPVGRVDGVRLTLDRRVELVLHVDREFQTQVREDTRGSALVTLSGKVVEIGTGSANSPVLADGGALQAGSNIDPVVALQSTSLLGNVDRLERALADIERILEQTDLGEARIPELIAAVLQILDDLQQGKGSLGRLIADDSVVNDVGRAVDEIDQIVTRLDQLSATLERTASRMDATASAVESQTGNLERTAKSVERSSAAVEKTSSAVPPALDDLKVTLDELDRTLKAIQQLPLVRGKLEDEAKP